ncbi:MAG: FAD-dependent oxidoreductase, partial [Clostridia bacterium]|nr:FAD-dependent oxidoreductase [Clostridia bacterium]
MTDLVIIGAGPCGMSAAIYAARAGNTVTLIEKKNYGGQMMLSFNVDNYPGVENISGAELSENMMKQVRKSGVKVANDEIVKIIKNGSRFIAVSKRNSYECIAVILANGGKYRKLNCEGEERLTGKGVSWCAVCDGPLFKGRDVAVIGGGDSAAEEALYLSEICGMVYLVHYKETFSAKKTLLDKLSLINNIKILKPYEVYSVNGEESVESITLKNRNNGDFINVHVNGVFEAIGYLPENGMFSELIKLDEKGYA